MIELYWIALAGGAAALLFSGGYTVGRHAIDSRATVPGGSMKECEVRVRCRGRRRRRRSRRTRAAWSIRLGTTALFFSPRRKGKTLMEIAESSLGIDCRVTFLKADGVTPAQIDGPPRWTLPPSEDGNPVGTLEVDPEDPFHAKVTPLPVPEDVSGPTHSTILTAEADADLDEGEERIVPATLVFTVRRDEAQSAGITATEITS